MHKNTLFLIKKLQKSPSAKAGGSALRPPCLRRQRTAKPPNLPNGIWQPDKSPSSFRNPGYATHWSSPIQHIAEARRTATVNVRFRTTNF